MGKPDITIPNEWNLFLTLTEQPKQADKDAAETKEAVVNVKVKVDDSGSLIVSFIHSYALYV